MLHRHGLPAEVLDAVAVHEREPAARPDVLGGVHFTGDASLDPARFLRLLAERRARVRGYRWSSYPAYIGRAEPLAGASACSSRRWLT